MVATSVVDNVAIELSNLLTAGNVYHVFFGGWVTVREGCDRETRDLDCYAATTKQDAIALLQNSAVVIMSHFRTDYLCLLWPAGDTFLNVVLFFGIYLV